MSFSCFISTLCVCVYKQTHTVQAPVPSFFGLQWVLLLRFMLAHGALIIGIMACDLSCFSFLFYSQFPPPYSTRSDLNSQSLGRQIISLHSLTRQKLARPLKKALTIWRRNAQYLIYFSLQCFQVKKSQFQQFGCDVIRQHTTTVLCCSGLIFT